MFTWTLLLTVLLVLARWYSHRPARALAAAARSPIRPPLRLSDPRTQGQSISPVWQLRHAPACRNRHGIALSGRRLALADTVPLSAPGKPACDCHYQPLPDQRRGERRQHSDRRAALRFDLRHGNRRQPAHSRRRGEQIWQPLQRL